MNRFEMFCTMVVLTIDVICFMFMGKGETISKLWMDIIVFTNGLTIGNILYYLLFQDKMKKKFGGK